VPVERGHAEVRWYEDKLGWAAVGGGLALTIAGTLMVVRAAGEQDDLTTSKESERGDLQDAVSRDRTVGLGGLILGGGLLVGGIVMLASTPARAGEAGVALGVRGTTLEVSGSF
jgi:hypothetical protein